MLEKLPSVLVLGYVSETGPCTVSYASLRLARKRSAKLRQPDRDVLTRNRQREHIAFTRVTRKAGVRLRRDT